MILSFTQEINGNKTYFIHKIWKSLGHCFEASQKENFRSHYMDFFGISWDIDISAPPKFHTIRKDKMNRWKVGKNIHPVINLRTKSQFQFCPTLECKSVQKITIQYDRHKQGDINNVIVTIDDELFYNGKEVLIHLPPLYRKTIDSEMDHLAHNDGFENKEAFFDYFNKDFTGKIIHWTVLKY